MPADKTAVDLFIGVGRLLYLDDPDHWRIRYAGALRVPPGRLKDIERGKANLDRDGRKDGLLEDALALAEYLTAKAAEELVAAQRQAANTAKARDALKGWFTAQRAASVRVGKAPVQRAQVPRKSGA